MKIGLFLACLFLPGFGFCDTFTVTVSTTVGARIKNGFGAAYDYKATLSDGSQNPESLAQFTLRKIKEYIKSVTVGAEVQAAMTTAQQNQIVQDNTDIVIP